MFDGGWGLLRASNTRAILVLRFEADSVEKLTCLERRRSKTASNISSLKNQPDF
jgi:phosphomannomutase